MFKQLLTFSFFTFLSRVSGFIREVLMTYTMGASFWSDICIIAIRLPNFFRRFFAEGALHAALVPELSQSKNPNYLMQNIFMFMFFLLIGLVIFVEIFAPQMLFIIAPGYKIPKENYAQSINFIRIAFPYVLAICLCAVLTAFLNYKKRFAPESSFPIILNIVTITGIIFAYKKGYMVPYFIVCSLIISGIIQLLYLYYFAKKCGLSLSFKLPKKTFEFISVLKRMLINSFGASILQINLLIDTYFASWLPKGSITYLFCADRIFQFPISMIGIAMGSILLSNFSNEKNVLKRKLLLKNSLLMAFQISICAFIGLFIFSKEIISILFLRGKFLEYDAFMTGKILMLYSIAIPAYVMSKTISSYLFAKKKPFLPFYASLLSVITNLIGNFLLIQKYGCVGMAFSTSISAWISFLFLLIFVFKKQIAYMIKDIVINITWGSLNIIVLIILKFYVNINIINFLIIGILYTISYFGLGHLMKIQRFIKKKEIFN